LHEWEINRIHTEFLSENQKKTIHLGDLSVDEKVILKMILEE
jgi:hypothetical protein